MEKIKALSKRIKAISAESPPLWHHQKIRFENLRYNLSYLLAQIILSLEFADKSKQAFLATIEEYNSQRGTKLTFEDFQKNSWIRFAADEAVIPNVIQSMVFSFGWAERDGKDFEFQEGKEDITRCLLNYSNKWMGKRPRISAKQLNLILKKHGMNGISVEFLTSRKILQKGSSNDYYVWYPNEYGRGLGTEIAAILWNEIGGKNPSVEHFKEFSKLLRKTEIGFGNLDQYLDYEQLKKLSQLAESFLLTEQDLEYSEDEFRKIWLDAYQPRGVEALEGKVPKILIDYTNPYSLIKDVEEHGRSFYYIFHVQSVRSFCYPLLKFIINTSLRVINGIDGYARVLKILKDISRPHLILELHRMLSDFPEMRPYLLSDPELAPLAFYKPIKINSELLPEERGKQIIKICEWENELWLEMFAIAIDNLYMKGEILVKILHDLVKEIFIFNQNNPNYYTEHNSLRKRYEDALKMLMERRGTRKFYHGNAVQPRYLSTIFAEISSSLSMLLIKKEKPWFNEFIKLDFGLIDLSIEILRGGNLISSENEIPDNKLEESKLKLLKSVEKHLIYFYTVKEVEILDYFDLHEHKVKRPKRGVNDFGSEIIDWAYLFLNFQQHGLLNNLNDKFDKSLTFNVEGGKYDDENKEQKEKIKIYLKSLMLAFASIRNGKDALEMEDLPVLETINKLENLIKRYALKYSKNELSQKRIDVFDTSLDILGHDIYYKNLMVLLFSCIKLFKTDSSQFISIFFADTFDIRRMLTARNTLDSPKLAKIITEKVENVNVNDFIDACFSTTELQHTLLEAINSKDHWNLSKPLILRLQQHFKRMKWHENHIENFLFEVNLLLAFKEKNFSKICNLEVPKPKHYTIRENPKNSNLKAFYKSIFKLYHDKNYSEAISGLKVLRANNNTNVRYAFHLYHGQTLLALERNDKSLFGKANLTWESFFNTLKNEQKKKLYPFWEGINSNRLVYYASIGDAAKFDQAIKALSAKSSLYDEDMIPVISNFYINRGMSVAAFEYLCKAENYHQEHGRETGRIQELLKKADSQKLHQGIKQSLRNIRGLDYKNIPKITPEILNNKGSLNEFVLCEIIQAAKILTEKIEGIRQITHEDRYNDLLLAILRLRFQLWGWSIHDQARTGRSSSGKNAGESDLTIQAGNRTFALIEAFNLKGQDKNKTQNHVKKIYTYNKTLERYYMVIYFIGKRNNFENAWETYRKDVVSSSFSTNFCIDKQKGFVDLFDNFDDVNNMKIAKSIHGQNVEVFHLMIDLERSD